VIVLPVAAKKTKSAVQTQQETISGTVLRRIFYNQETGFCVLSIKVNDENQPIPEDFLDGTIKMSGSMSSVREGDSYKFSGNWSNHPKFGMQFQFTSSELLLPSGTTGVARYLSNITYGVGMAKAKRIVEALGEDCLQRIKDFPELLDTLDFLDEKQRSEISEDLTKNSVQAELAGLICKEGIGPGMVARIMNKYGQEAVKVVKENPYLLSDEVNGIGFITADSIAQTVGIAPNSPYRIEAALNFSLNEAGNDGHVFLQPNDIIAALLGRRDLKGRSIQKGIIEGSGVTVPEIKEANEKLISDGRCIREGDAVYSAELHYAECNVAKIVRRLLHREINLKGANLDGMIADIESKTGGSYAPEQKEGIKAALSNPLSVLTGGPGTGKSHTTNAIVSIYRQLFPENVIYLAAPTGRASKRLREATNRPASTIHRLLKYNPGESGFEYNYDNPLPGPGLLIVDESSMVDIQLASDLFSAINDLQVVMVGDVDQLPSVGPGNLLRDLINSGVVPTVRLSFNFRQAGGSKIAEIANVICGCRKESDLPELQTVGDFEFIEVPMSSAPQAAEIILNMIRDLTAQGYGPMDFAVLSAMRKGHTGVTEMNSKIREIVNPVEIGKPILFNKYRLGDKVMVIKNQYKLGVFNGDIGQIVEVDLGKSSILVDFGSDDGYVKFTGDNLDLLTLSYASTIHKSQGSEFPIVFLPMVSEHTYMAQKNLLYTGITRAKKRLVLVADMNTLKRCIKNNEPEKRYSMLAERIRK
jgi:exodeoxyribonuclease V alpha subunit